MTYIIKITNVPRLSGEYPGGATLAEARAEAATFLPHLPADARVRIVVPSADGESLHTVETVREG